MRRLLQVVCVFLAVALLPAAVLISRELPADPHPYVERKYAGWNGVLRVWVCAEWSCAGGFSRWLSACAADFERKHEGVYIEFTQVDAAGLNRLDEDGVRPPELLFFSPGVLRAPSKLVPIDASDAVRNTLRDELRNFGGGLACPVAMGGYIWVYNRARTDGAPTVGDAIAAPDDIASHSYSAAMVALLSDVPGTDSIIAPDDPGVDLGLSIEAAAEAATDSETGSADAPLRSEDALECFIAGELPVVAVTQAELSRLIRLRDAGRGPDWTCAAAGQVAYTDQLLLLGVVEASGDCARERQALAQEFGASLLEPAAQARLADIGAFSVTGACVHAEFSAYAALDRLLNSRELLFPADPWARVPDCAALALELARGELPPEQAVALLREALC